MAKQGVIRLLGKQYIVSEGDEITVDKIDAKEKETVSVPLLLRFNGSEKVEIGAPELKDQATIEVVEHLKGDKVRVAKFKSKVRYRKVSGFRPELTRVKVSKI